MQTINPETTQIKSADEAGGDEESDKKVITPSVVLYHLYNNHNNL